MGLATSQNKTANSVRAGLLPVCLDRVPLSALAGIDIYLKTAIAQDHAESFTLFCAGTVCFTEAHRQRLIDGGVKFIYLPIAEQTRFRRQMESGLLNLATDPSLALSARAEIVYETSVELINELLTEPDLAGKTDRLEGVSRAVTMLVLNDPSAFSHLFAAAHHDFYTATHMVNVSACMVALAQAMGHHDPDELNHVCQAGLLHDIGKMFISTELLNKTEQLSHEEWDLIQQHPRLGHDYLAKCDGINPLACTVAWEHHERMDGNGYPRRLSGEQIHPVSRMCAVVDSFDAMTAVRPFKRATLSVSEALKTLLTQSPEKYDLATVQAWASLLQSAAGVLGPQIGGFVQSTASHHRDFERFRINCAAQLHVLERNGDGWDEHPPIQVVAHNVSRSGMGALCKSTLEPGTPVRVYLGGAASLNQMNEGVTVRCEQRTDGWYEIGIKYGPLSVPDLPPVAGAA